MPSVAGIAEIAALIGDQARASMMAALMDGRALTASELAYTARITPQTASAHLGRLTAARLLVVEKQGRHRYHRLASPEVAHMLEGIMAVADAGAGAPARRAIFVGPRDAALRAARTCYDHLAGRLAVAMADAMIGRGDIELTADGGAVTESGARFLQVMGVDLDGGRPAVTGRAARVFCRPCLDWSERRPHLAGVVGAAICSRCMGLGWVRRVAGTRALDVSPEGWRGLRAAFGRTVEDARP